MSESTAALVAEIARLRELNRKLVAALKKMCEMAMYASPENTDSSLDQGDVEDARELASEAEKEA